MAYHVSRHINKAFAAPGLVALFEPGQAGVDVFFTLSGFIILHVHRTDIGRPTRLAHYLGRRFTRVLPLYWIALLVAILMGSAASHTWPPPWRLFFSVLLLPSHQEPLLGVAWTLQFEVLFYTAFALLILNRTLGAMVLAAWFLCIACSVSGLTLALLPPQLTGIYGLEFFIGMATAQLLHNGRAKNPGLVAGAGLGLFVIGLLLATRVTGEFGAAARLIYAVPTSLIIFGLASMDQAGVDFVPEWARRIGGASYSIYLFQFVFIGIVWQAIKRGGLDHAVPSPALFLILAVSAVAGGVLTSRWIETPMLNLLRR